MNIGIPSRWNSSGRHPQCSAPGIDNPRARFWFTERGWDRFGRALVAEGRRRGYVVKVIRRKNPRRSQIVYKDEWQVALLPLKGEPREQ